MKRSCLTLTLAGLFLLCNLTETRGEQRGALKSPGVLRSIQLGTDRFIKRGFGSSDYILPAKITGTPALFQREGKTYAVVGSQNGGVFTVDVLQGQIVGRVDLPDSVLSSPALLKLGEKLFAVVTCRNRNLYLISIPDGRIAETVSGPGGGTPSSPVLFSDDDSFFVAVGSDYEPLIYDPCHYYSRRRGFLHIVDLKRLWVTAAIPDRWPVFQNAAPFRDGNRTYVAAILSLGVAIVEPTRGEVLKTISVGPPVDASSVGSFGETAVFEQAGKPYLAVGRNNILSIIDLRAGSVAQALPLTQDPSIRINVVGSFNLKEERHLVAVTDVGNAYIIKVLNGKIVKTFKLTGSTRPTLFEKHNRVFLTVGGRYGTFGLYDVMMGKEIGVVQTDARENITSASAVFDDNGGLFAVVGDDEGVLHTIQFYASYESR